MLPVCPWTRLLPTASHLSEPTTWNFEVVWRDFPEVGNSQSWISVLPNHTLMYQKHEQNDVSEGSDVYDQQRAKPGLPCKETICNNKVLLRTRLKTFHVL